MSDGSLRQIFRKYLPHFDWQAVETGLTGRGIPDANYCYKGIEGWIEYKQTQANAVGIRPEQVGWIERRVRHGGRVFIATRHQSKDRDDLYLFSGEHARNLKDMGLKCQKQLLKASKGPKHWPWDIIGELLKGNSVDDELLAKFHFLF
jgi:hypothetical protein